MRKKNSNTIIHRVFFDTFLVLLPVQLGKHFWPAFSLVHGVRSDYLAPTVYLTDIILMFLAGSYLIEKFKAKQAFPHLVKPVNVPAKVLFTIIATVFFLLNIIQAVSPVLAFLKLLRIIACLFAAWYIAVEKPRMERVLAALLCSTLY